MLKNPIEPLQCLFWHYQGSMQYLLSFRGTRLQKPKKSINIIIHQSSQWQYQYNNIIIILLLRVTRSEESTVLISRLFLCKLAWPFVANISLQFPRSKNEWNAYSCKTSSDHASLTFCYLKSDHVPFDLLSHETYKAAALILHWSKLEHFDLRSKGI